ncbi:unnamed protein product [Enterobius vermicularis]|uniref:MD-2-related lipid-recognition domain-containing protein n=1 Tax=Enterobius vermicularis TaxID=51028 RepID=A0A0N4VIH1_ENTVE|nr:unnamed protein product [Enterobius vermicularis]
MQRLFILLEILTVSLAKNCGYPNGTATTFKACTIDLNSRLLQIEKYKIDVDVSKYKTALFDSTYKWHSVPTLGLTSNIDGCVYSCPLLAGDNDLDVKVDLSGESGLILLIVGKNALQLLFYIKDLNNNELGCVYGQLKAVG